MKNYDMFTLMLDCSRNAVMNLPSLKKLILLLEKMGYDSLMLYTEDTYEVEGEPYFGYLRGRYSVQELQEICAFGKEHHVELIPCIQTLAHLNCIFQHACYSSINDVNDILLVEEKRTYELIDHMFASLEKSFLSRKVHIGMDEAHMLGLGKYKDKYGAQDRVDIFVRHLKKVYEIAKKHGFEPMMWSDMFFRLASGGEYYDLNAKLDLSKLEGLPPVKQIYWDYYHEDEPFYERMIDLHRQIDEDVIFAGGVWTWAGFAPLLSYAEQVSAPAIEACKRKGVKKIIVTAWGDDGAECSIFSSLTSLFYIREHALGVTSLKDIEKDFFETFGYSYKDFKLLEKPNFLSKRRKDGSLLVNPCKYFLYNDPLLGKFDSRYNMEDEALYLEWAKELKEAAGRVGEYSYIFETLSSLCSLLSPKLGLGAKLRDAYQSKDRARLSSLLKEIDECVLRLDDFSSKFRLYWRKENKGEGLEVIQVRNAGVKERLLEAKRVVQDYLDHDEPIEELEGKILPLDPEEEDEREPMCYNTYLSNFTASRT